MSALTVQSLSVRLGQIEALSGIDLAFAPGRVTVLLGPNGAGKSTLLSCLAGLRQPDTGSVLLDGHPVDRLDRRERARRIGLLPQGQETHWNIDVETLVGLGRFPWRGRHALGAADKAAIARAMQATDTSRFARRGVEHLSGGERARALLARVLAGEPQWLLADEPLASLDPAHQMEVAAVLRQTADAGAGVLLVLHDLNLAARIADDVVLLRQGRLVAAGSARDTLTPRLIGKTFGVDVEIGRTESGQPYIMPVAP